MGSALLQGLLGANLAAPGQVVAFDAHPASLEACREQHGILAAASNEDVFQRADSVLLCVKPADCRALLEGLPPSLPPRLLISIVAGVSISSLETWTGSRHRIVRVMPNTPALIGRGASAFAPSTSATAADRDLTRTILEGVGLAFEIDEARMDAVTALSGSGPAYVYTIIDALADGGVRQGLPKELALQLAAQTVAGAADLVLQSGLHPAQLKDRVISPGGTTIAGLEAMESAGLRGALLQGVSAAAGRSRELGRGSAES